MEDFVNYDIAVKLKEKGFKEKCVAFYNMDNLEVGLIQGQVRISNQLIVRLEDVSTQFNLSNDDRFFDVPTIFQVLKWLRDKKKIFVAINIGYCYESYEIPFPTNPKMEPILKGYYYGIWELDNLNDKNALSEYFEAPEFAILAGIEYVIDNLI